LHDSKAHLWDNSKEESGLSRSTRLILICHGTTAATQRSAFPADEGLLASNSELLERIRQALPHADHVLSGPEIRTRQTAEALAPRFSVDPTLGDVSCGRWAGKQLSAVEREDPEGLMAWITTPEAAPHGGESIVQAISRMSDWLRGRLTIGGTTIAVTHPAIARAAIVAMLDAPATSFWKLGALPLSLTELTSDGRRWALKSFNRPAD
jgi:broad specificity phosphatase PhoE